MVQWWSRTKEYPNGNVFIIAEGRTVPSVMPNHEEGNKAFGTLFLCPFL